MLSSARLPVNAQATFDATESASIIVTASDPSITFTGNTSTSASSAVTPNVVSPAVVTRSALAEATANPNAEADGTISGEALESSDFPSVFATAASSASSVLTVTNPGTTAVGYTYHYLYTFSDQVSTTNVPAPSGTGVFNAASVDLSTILSLNDTTTQTLSDGNTFTSGNITITLPANTTDTLTIDTSITGLATSQLVPEPGAYALCASLVVTGATFLRRRRSRVTCLTIDRP
jgi:hypothetical protein